MVVTQRVDREKNMVVTQRFDDSIYFYNLMSLREKVSVYSCGYKHLKIQNTETKVILKCCVTLPL